MHLTKREIIIVSSRNINTTGHKKSKLVNLLVCVSLTAAENGSQTWVGETLQLNRDVISIRAIEMQYHS